MAHLAGECLEPHSIARETKEGKASGQCLGIIQLAQSLVTLKPHGAGVIAEEFDSKIGLVFKLFDVKRSVLRMPASRCT